MQGQKKESSESVTGGVIVYIRKKGNKFYFTLTVTNPDGTARRVERVGGKTRREANLKAREFMKQLV